MYDFTTLGALIGLAIAIVLIIRKVHPAYSLILGALIGGIIGGGGLTTTVDTMVSGAQSMMSSVLRIMTSGILAGALIKTGSAQKIAETIVDKMGERLEALNKSYGESTRMLKESSQSVVKKVAKLEKLGATRKRSNAALKTGGRMIGGRESVIPTMLAPEQESEDN